jgi:hypothetical protein
MVSFMDYANKLQFCKMKFPIFQFAQTEFLIVPKEAPPEPPTFSIQTYFAETISLGRSLVPETSRRLVSTTRPATEFGHDKVIPQECIAWLIQQQQTIDRPTAGAARGRCCIRRPGTDFRTRHENARRYSPGQFRSSCLRAADLPRSKRTLGSFVVQPGPQRRWSADVPTLEAWDGHGRMTRRLA